MVKKSASSDDHEPQTTTATEVDGDRHIYARGEIDLSTAEAFRASLDESIAAGDGDVIVDLRDVAFMDSTGIAQLVGAAGQLRSGRRLVIRHAEGPVRKVIDVTGLSAVPEIVVDEDADEAEG